MKRVGLAAGPSQLCGDVEFRKGVARMASGDDIRRLTATVRGYVQGVGYRYCALQHARALGLTGFARNERDHSVTVVAEGSADLLAHLLDALRRGPEGADVHDVESAWGPATHEYPTFRIAATV